MRSFCPMETKHCDDNWFCTIMLCTDTSRLAAIMPHVSPSRTVYSNGGREVSVGRAVGGRVSVAVGVIVGVSVAVPSAVGSVIVAPVSPDRRLKYTAAAPTSRMSVRAPSAAGRLNVISGMRLACMPVSAFFDFAEAFAVISVPQTRQRVALSLRRVPQVGQICDF